MAKDYRRGLTYIEVRAIVEQWCEEVGVSEYDTWNHPFSNEDMTVLQVAWSLYNERNMSVEALHSYFDRHMDAVNAGNRMRGIQLSDDLWAEVA